MQLEALSLQASVKSANLRIEQDADASAALSGRKVMIDRRAILHAAAGLASAALFPSLSGAAESVVLPFGNGDRPLAKYPQKRPLIQMTARPPQLETPFSVFNDGVITPNDAFFVRYHLADIPLSIDPDAFRLQIGGKVNTPLSLSLTELK